MLLEAPIEEPDSEWLMLEPVTLRPIPTVLAPWGSQASPDKRGLNSKLHPAVAVHGCR